MSKLTRGPLMKHLGYVIQHDCFPKIFSDLHAPYVGHLYRCDEVTWRAYSCSNSAFVIFYFYFFKAKKNTSFIKRNATLDTALWIMNEGCSWEVRLRSRCYLWDHLIETSSIVSYVLLSGSCSLCVSIPHPDNRERWADSYERSLTIALAQQYAGCISFYPLLFICLPMVFFFSPAKSVKSKWNILNDSLYYRAYKAGLGIQRALVAWSTLHRIALSLIAYIQPHPSLLASPRPSMHSAAFTRPKVCLYIITTCLEVGETVPEPERCW